MRCDVRPLNSGLVKTLQSNLRFSLRELAGQGGSKSRDRRRACGALSCTVGDAYMLPTCSGVIVDALFLADEFQAAVHEARKTPFVSRPASTLPCEQNKE